MINEVVNNRGIALLTIFSLLVMVEFAASLLKPKPPTGANLKSARTLSLVFVTYDVATAMLSDSTLGASTGLSCSAASPDRRAGQLPLRFFLELKKAR